jgi:hypothetical protein
VADKYEAYCVKCRAKREFEGTVVELKNGRKAAQGICPVCGTKVMRILGKTASRARSQAQGRSRTGPGRAIVSSARSAAARV